MTLLTFLADNGYVDDGRLAAMTTNTAVVELGYGDFVNKKVAVVTWDDQVHECCGQVWGTVDADRLPVYVDNHGTNLAEVRGLVSQCRNCGSVQSWEFSDEEQWVPRRPARHEEVTDTED